MSARGDVDLFNRALFERDAVGDDGPIAGAEGREHAHARSDAIA